MPSVRPRPENSVLVVVDIQPKFMAAIHEAERVSARSLFLTKVAKILEIPILATEQNMDRMGPTEPAIAALVDQTFGKMCFSCGGCTPFMEALAATGRKQAILVGIETHICVSQTALDLQAAGYDVVVCPDSLSARTQDRHKLGMERMRDAGIVPIHTEAVAYEWLQTAEHPRFREALAVVKEHA